MTQGIRVRLFARFRDLFGTDVLEVLVSAAPTIAELRQRIGQQKPEVLPLLAYSTFAVNHEFASEDTLVTPADDVALIPPVSGG